MNTSAKIKVIIATILLVAGIGVTTLALAPLAHAQAGAADAPAAAPEAAPTAADAAAKGLSDTTIKDLSGSIPGTNDIIVQFSKILALVLRLISTLLWPLLMFAGGLMKSDFLYTGAIDLKLTEMWIQVRNLVNIIYVILLLAVALYNVLGLGESVDFLQIKTALPKIILGLILVNFSYAGVKVVLDVVNVSTVFAFSIPRTDPQLTFDTENTIKKSAKSMCQSMGAGDAADAVASTKELKKEYDDKFNAKVAACTTKPKTGKAKTKEQCTKEIKQLEEAVPEAKGICKKNAEGQLVLDETAQKLLSSWNVDGALTIMAVKFMKMQDLSTVAEKIKKDGSITGLTINMLFSLVMYLIYAISFIVLVIVLFMRAAVLWMVIVFSPLLVVNLTFPSLVSQLGGGGEFVGKITKTLIAPIIIGFVLSIGFILLSTMQNINYGGIGGYITDAPVSSLDTFQDLLIAIGSVVFVWLGIQSAISGTIGDSIAGGIMEAAKGAGQWIAKAPFFYAPIFQIKTPHGTHGEVVSLGTLSAALNIAKHKPETHADEEARRIFGFDGKATLKDVRSKDGLKDLFASKDAAYFAANEASRKELQEALKRIETTEGKFQEGGAHAELVKALKNNDVMKANEQINKIRATAATGASGSAGAAPTGPVDTSSFDAKKKGDDAAREGMDHLSPGDKAKAQKVLSAADQAAFDAANREGNPEAFKAAAAIGNAKQSLKSSTELSEFLTAIKRDKPQAEIDAAAGKLKTKLQGFISELGTAGISDTDADKQAEILSAAVKDLMKSDGPLKTKQADVATQVGKVIKAINGRDNLATKATAEIAKN